MISVIFVKDKKLGMYTAYIPDVPVCGEGPTKEKALEHLKEGLAFYIEEEGKEAFLSRIVGAMEHEEIELTQLV